MKRPEIRTVANLEATFAGESMAHIKYRYFAKLARAAGDEDTARAFEEAAEQEVMHAFGHLDLLYPTAEMTPAKCLEVAIAGETYEYSEMYSGFRKVAEEEGNAAAVKEMDEQIAESVEHAQRFAAVLAKAQKRFAALARSGPEARATIVCLHLTEKKMNVCQCIVCGFIYDESEGLPEEVIAGTAWAHIPDDWACPDCGRAKSDFEMAEIA